MNTFCKIYCSCGIIYIGYNYNTRFEKTITIKNKFILNNRKFITDYKNNNYNIDNSIYNKQFNSIELWSNIQIGRTYLIKGKGIKNNIFNLFPNIYFIKMNK